MIRQMITASLLSRPVRSLVSVLAVALEVTLILVIVGLTTGISDESGRRIVGVGADITLQPPNSSMLLALSSASMPMAISTGSGWLDPFMEPMVAGSYAGGYGTCYTPYGYGYRSYYGMCSAYGASYLSSYYAPGYYMPGGSYSGWVDVGALQPPSGGTSTTPPSADGRMVAGRGYTQIRSRDPEPAPRSGNRAFRWIALSTVLLLAPKAIAAVWYVLLL